MRFFSPLLDILYPSFCPVCGLKNTFNLCLSCWEKIEPFNSPLCPKCGRPFSSEVAVSHSPDHLCSDCRDTRSYFDRAISVGPYEGTLAEAIHLFKYRGRKGLARPLGKIMVQYLSSNSSLFPTASLKIIPVPLHPKRLRQREFNQSLLLAKWVSKALAIPLILDNLQRIRWTRPQIELKGKERLVNVRGAFALKDHNAMEGNSFLLIDDVYTTGATVKECSNVLKKAGAKKVYVLTLARAI